MGDFMPGCLRTHCAVVQREIRNMEACLLAGAAGRFLEAMLKALSLMFRISKKYRENILDFQANYLFLSKDGSLVVTVLFDAGELRVHHGTMGTPNLTVRFRDAGALAAFLLSPEPDVLNAMLRQDVVLDGNLNYLYKFAYLFNHVRHELRWRL